MNAEDFRSSGVLPSGPVSAWPKSRNEKLTASAKARQLSSQEDPEVKVGIGRMANGLLKTGAQAIRNGRVSNEIREERYAMCKECPSFNRQNRRCSDCGCFMEAKTWVGGNPKKLCPQKKWLR